MVTNEIKRLRRQLNLLEQEGAYQLLLRFHQFLENNNFPPTSINTVVNKGFVRSLKIELELKSPKTKQTEIEYE